MGELKKLVEEGNTDTSVCLSCVHQRSVGLMQFTQLRQYSWNGPYGQGSGGRNSPYLQSLPRFQPENVEHNNTMFEIVNEMAAKKGCTPGQVALGWVHHQGSDVCPILGSTKIENFDQNIGALSVKLTPEDMAELESIADAVKGGRDGGVVLMWKNSETPPLSSWMAE